MIGLEKGRKLDKREARYGLWGTIIGAVIVGSISLFIHCDSKHETASEQTQIVSDTTATLEQSASLSIARVTLPSVNTELESAIQVEIYNPSLHDAYDVVVRVNFGEAEVYQCEVVPGGIVEQSDSTYGTIVAFEIDEIRSKESIYIYCLTSAPVFNSINVTGGNVRGSVKLDFVDIEEVAKGMSAFTGFLLVVLGGAILALAIYAVVIIITLINRKLGFTAGQE